MPGGADLAARHAAELAQLGPYFAVNIHPPGQPLADPWRPLSSLLDSPDDLRQRIADGPPRARRGPPARRRGVPGRRLSDPPRGGGPADLPRPRDGGPLRPGAAGWTRPRSPGSPCSAARCPCRSRPPPSPGAGTSAGEEQPGEGQLASELRQSLLQGPVRALTEVTAAMSVSPIVLDGNIASAVNAAAAMIAAARPGLATRAAALRRALLNAPELAGYLDRQRGRVPQAKLLPDLPGLPGGHLGGLRGLRPQRDAQLRPGPVSRSPAARDRRSPGRHGR